MSFRRSDGSTSSRSALAFMAGYGLRAFLIAQSLNQIDKAYGPNNSILDNCHVRVAFATNDERTAKRISDALGTATELRAQRNYAGHRLAPWLGHLMVSRQETARPLLTPGEVMQLPPDDAVLMVSGSAAGPREEAALLRGSPTSPSASCRRLRPRLPAPATLRLRTPTTGWQPSHSPTATSVSRTAAIAGAEDEGGGLLARKTPRTGRSPSRDRRRSKHLSRSTPTSTRRPGSSSSLSLPSRVPRDSLRSIPRTGSRYEPGTSQSLLQPEHAKRLEELATMRGLSKSSIVAAALASFLSPDAGDQREAAIARRLDRLSRQFELSRARPDHPHRDGRALRPLLPHRQHARSRAHQEAARAQGQGALRAIRRAARPALACAARASPGD